MDRTKTAIVVDDDSDTRDIISELLEINEVQVIGKGCNGKEAVELYRELEPMIAVLDVMMPNFDGLYALENIKKHDPGARIIMITGDVTEQTREKMHGLGANAILYKPIEMSKLFELVNTLCGSATLVQSPA